MHINKGRNVRKTRLQFRRLLDSHAFPKELSPSFFPTRFTKVIFHDQLRFFYSKEFLSKWKKIFSPRRMEQLIREINRILNFKCDRSKEILEQLDVTFNLSVWDTEDTEK